MSPWGGSRSLDYVRLPYQPIACDHAGMSFKFYVYDIQWLNSLGLPDDATISLSDDLVEATDLEEDEWQGAVNDQLQRQFGERAISFQMTGDDD